ncbi:spore germination protein [Halalkalibacter krulwichiae]|uniref:spore germination protein n=1 Tax=Halalkalibacter krulwichiae TaxID=199441 RepID=UPI001F22AD3F|nr:spore germination protein [Halalkalibacter krulwichiae]
MNETVDSIRKVIGESTDVIQRDFTINHYIRASLFYIDGLSGIDHIEQNIIKPLTDSSNQILRGQPIERVVNEVVSVSNISIVDNFDDAILPVMSGDSLLVIDGYEKLITLDTRQMDKRSIQEPQSEIVVRGPRDGFIELLQSNIMLIRRRIKDPNLVVQQGKIGRRSKTDFALLYMKGIAPNELIEEVRFRISCIDLDGVLESGTVEQLIEENVFSPFPQLGNTERPDKAAGALMNGQVLIAIDGSPYVLIAPVVLEQLFKSPEDYYERWFIGTLIRSLRAIAAIIALLLPGVYIAVVSFHQGMIPTTLALSIAGTREGVPFPAFIEAILMEFTIELLREAGVRLPRPVGQTIGIVGGLVIGDAAVRAGIVSPVMVIVVALTAIASFALPAYSISISIRILRFSMMIAASILGLYGMILFYIAINIHLVGLRSFGSYYTAPIAPYDFPSWLDLIWRAPTSILRKRSVEPETQDNTRQSDV